MGWPAVVAITLLAVAYGSFVLENRIELLKEESEWLEKRLVEQKENSPDILARHLAEKSHLLAEELESLAEEHNISEKMIQGKEAELADVKVQITRLQTQIDKAQELLRFMSDYGLVCPQCSAPLEIRDYHVDSREYNGRELDIEHEMIRYQCGLEIIDNKVISECQSSNSTN